MGWSDFTLLKTELPCEQATPFLGAYTKEKKSEYKRCLHDHVFNCGTIFNSRNMESA